MNCIIIHGTMGCPDENWFLWAQTEIAKILGCEKYEVLTPHFPYVPGSGPNKGYDLWKNILLSYKNAGLINQETIFIGHSLGPVFIYRFLQETKTYVKAVVSVSGKNNNWLNLKAFDNFNFDFYYDWKKLAEASVFSKYRYAIYSTNDPYISLLNCKKFAKATGSEEIVLENAGHINAKAGYTKFPLLLDVIKKIQKNEPIKTQLKSETFLDLEEPIEESADLISDKAKELCGHGIMGEDCTWYHSVWQYLRLMNLVSTPAWHDEFYQQAFYEAFKKKNECKVLVSGTADYSILAYILYVAKQAKCNVAVDVLDTCKTPLFACEWFAKREGVKINTINKSIFDYSPSKKYDVVCSDAFLTRFKKAEAKEVIEKWKSLLRIGGQIITTVRVYDSSSKLSKEEKEMKVNEFVEKAKERSAKIQDRIQFSPNKIGEMAHAYATRMKSNNLGNEKSVVSLFDGMENKYKVNTVLGEFERTKYVEIVSTKK